ncbi:hypothetical protein KCU93_g9785, partial [Aureobasidium melanogenum]
MQRNVALGLIIILLTLMGFVVWYFCGKFLVVRNPRDNPDVVLDDLPSRHSNNLSRHPSSSRRANTGRVDTLPYSNPPDGRSYPSHTSGRQTVNTTNSGSTLPGAKNYAAPAGRSYPSRTSGRQTANTINSGSTLPGARNYTHHRTATNPERTSTRPSRSALTHRRNITNPERLETASTDGNTGRGRSKTFHSDQLPIHDEQSTYNYATDPRSSADRTEPVDVQVQEWLRHMP